MKGKKHTDKSRQKIRDAMKGKKNAEVYTEEFVTEILSTMWDYASESYEVEVKVKREEGLTGDRTTDKTITEKVTRKLHLQESLLIAFNIKNPKWFSQMADKFENNETISYLLSSIKMICKVNTYEDAANKVTDSTLAKMNLSHHYGWADTSNLNIKKEGKSDEELQKEIDDYERRNKK